MKYLFATLLFITTLQAEAFMRTELLDSSIVVTKESLYFFDKFGNKFYKVTTNCDVNNKSKVIIQSRFLKEDVRLEIINKDKVQTCKVENLVIGSR